MRKLAALGTGLLVLPLVVGPARSAPPPAMSTTLVPAPVTNQAVTYAVRDGAGNLIRNASYRVTDAGGNCCEVHVATSASGQILELGAGYPFFSSDRGATWQRVSPTIGNNGEGSVTPAPGGDIVGVTWSIDRLTAYKFEASTGLWFSSDVVLHTPMYDRPWLTVVPGPFTQPGIGTVPYLTILRGGFPAKAEFISYDGLTYVEPSVTQLDTALNGATSGALPVTADAALDYMQPPYGAQTAPMHTGAIRTGLCGSGVGVLTASAQWSCRNLPGGRTDTAHVDSRGWLHEVHTSGRTIVYRVSTNGGTSWSSTTTTLPGGASAAFAAATIDFKSNGALQKTAVAVRAAIGGAPGTQQDLAFVYSYAGGVPSLTEVHYIGLGDVGAGAGITTSGRRLDFSTIGILPDGKIVTSLYDSTVGQPALAVEL